MVTVLTNESAKVLFAAGHNLKHRAAMFKMGHAINIYACGFMRIFTCLVVVPPV